MNEDYWPQEIISDDPSLEDLIDELDLFTTEEEDLYSYGEY
jgi:hypothetical protein